MAQEQQNIEASHQNLQPANMRFIDQLACGKPMSEEAQRLSGAMGRYEEMEEVHYEALAVRTKERDAAQAEARVWKFLAFVLAVCVVLAVAVAAVHGGR